MDTAQTHLALRAEESRHTLALRSISRRNTFICPPLVCVFVHASDILFRPLESVDLYMVFRDSSTSCSQTNDHITEHFQLLTRINTRSTCLSSHKINLQATLSDPSIIGPNAIGILCVIYCVSILAFLKQLYLNLNECFVVWNLKLNKKQCLV